MGATEKPVNPVDPVESIRKSFLVLWKMAARIPDAEASPENIKITVNESGKALEITFSDNVSTAFFDALGLAFKQKLDPKVGTAEFVHSHVNERQKEIILNPANKKASIVEFAAQVQSSVIAGVVNATTQNLRYTQNIQPSL